MIIYEMEQETYTDVCTKCENPVAVQKAKKPCISLLREIAIIVLLAIVSLPLLVISFALGWIAVPLWLLYFYHRSRQQSRCPTCRHCSLIPISSPKGKTIMEKHGWKPL